MPQRRFADRARAQAEVSLYRWKEPKNRIPLAVRHVRTFLRAHQPVPATR